MANPFDLKQPIPPALARQQPSGTLYKMEVDGVRHDLFLDQDTFLGDRLLHRLRSEQGWFEKLVQHAPSVGTFYEDSLRSLVSELLPSRLRAGTGFVFDPETRLSSKQIDILLYNDENKAPLYRRGEFVVVSPEMTLGLCEVKKRLELADIRKIVSETFMSHFGSHVLEPARVHRICLFGYSCRSKNDSIFSVLLEALESQARIFQMETIGGKQVLLEARNVVLPCVYILDRDTYFESTIAPNTDGKCGNYHLDVAIR